MHFKMHYMCKALSRKGGVGPLNKIKMLLLCLLHQFYIFRIDSVDLQLYFVQKKGKVVIGLKYNTFWSWLLLIKKFIPVFYNRNKMFC